MTGPRVLVAVAVGLGAGGVPSTPPFALLTMPDTSETRVAVAVWPDGHVVRVTGNGTYAAGTLDTSALKHLTCELEAIDLWNFATDGPPVLEPSDGITLRRGKERRHWLLATADDGQRFRAFRDTKQLLSSVVAPGNRLAWDGVVPPTWNGASPVTPPKCRQLVNPADLLAELQQRQAREVVERLFDQPGRWAALMDGIASGEEIWLQIATRLRPGTDAHASEETGMAIEDAFLKSPAAVLDRFGAEAACGGLGLGDREEARPADLQANWKLRHALASRLQSPEAKECLAALEKIKPYYFKS